MCKISAKEKKKKQNILMSGSCDEYSIIYFFQMVSFYLSSDYNPPYPFLVINRENNTSLLVLVLLDKSKAFFICPNIILNVNLI